MMSNFFVLLRKERPFSISLIMAFAFIFNVSASNADLFSMIFLKFTELSDLEVVENVIAQNQNSTIEEINSQIITNNFLSSSFELAITLLCS